MGPETGGEDDRDSMFLPGMEPDPNASPADNSTNAPEKTSTSNSHMSADANLNLTNAGAPAAADTAPVAHTSTDVAPGPTQHQRTAPPDYVEPLWMRRTKLVMFVMACIYLGIILIILPWNEAWTQNGIIHRYPALRDLAMSNFVRGAITGLGFVNVWLGVWEAVHYREKK